MTGTGYVRQSSAQIQPGNVITSAGLNNEFNLLQSTFNNSSGHAHDGGVGGGAPITGLVGLFANATMQTFITSGTYTPTSNMQYCVVLMVGGGAGGQAGSRVSTVEGGAGGGSGEFAIGVFTAATVGASQTVTIGAGGAGGGSDGTNGSNGAVTSLGTLLTAAGGDASATSARGTQGGQGGNGGTGTGLHIHGGDGMSAISANNISNAPGAAGGSSFFGGPGFGAPSLYGDGTAPHVPNTSLAYGSGGSGGACNAAGISVGAQAAGGVIIVIEFVSNT